MGFVSKRKSILHVTKLSYVQSLLVYKVIIILGQKFHLRIILILPPHPFWTNKKATKKTTTQNKENLDRIIDIKAFEKQNLFISWILLGAKKCETKFKSGL